MHSGPRSYRETLVKEDIGRNRRRIAWLILLCITNKALRNKNVDSSNSTVVIDTGLEIEKIRNILIMIGNTYHY